MALYVVGGQFDEHRNTSRTWAVPPNALPDALKSLAALRRSDPALVQWLEDGHPRLTEASHSERFGEPYRGKSSRKSSFVQSDRKDVG